MKYLLAVLFVIVLSSCAIYKDRNGGTHVEVLPPPVAVVPAPAPPMVYYPGYYNYSPRVYYYR